MKLDPISIRWALESLSKLGDSDLFPKPAEFFVFADELDKVVDTFSTIDISNHNPGSPRRFIVPKDNLSYRAATQLDPMDSVVFTAIMHQFGAQIESRRIPVDQNRVFSYRFCPSIEGDLYDSREAWNCFWNQCYLKSKEYEYALILDISDFYNQIYHHTIENQLGESGFPNQIIKWIMKLMVSISATVSRGIPVGPHPSHLIAEACFIPIDNSLAARGLDFCRFVDDIILFANDESTLRTLLYQIAEILDKQQRLQLQKSKTAIMQSNPFRDYCYHMIEDRPINFLERKLISVVEKYAKGNPYRTVFLSELSEEDLQSISKDAVDKILSDYLKQKEPDFARLRWFVRRLSQTRHPAAIEFLLNNFEKLIPALSDICHYFASIGPHAELDWANIGGKLIELLDNEIVCSNEYFQLSIYSLFNRATELDHTPTILRKYKNSSPALRREIILTASAINMVDWLRELKEDFLSMDPWTRRAFLYACRILPDDERKHFIRYVNSSDILEKLISDWAK